MFLHLFHTKELSLQCPSRHGDLPRHLPLLYLQIYLLEIPEQQATLVRKKTHEVHSASPAGAMLPSPKHQV